MKLDRRFFLSSLSLCCLLSFASNDLFLSNAFGAEPSSLPGWETPEDEGSSRGVTLNSKGVSVSSPVIAEIDGDVSNGKEVAIGSSDSMVHVLKADGTALWSKKLPNFNCKSKNGGDRLLSSPAVGALYGDGVPYVVIGYGQLTGRSCDGGISVFRGSDGELAWNFALQPFNKRERVSGVSFGVFGTPAIADTDGDGKMEIGFGALDRNIYLLNADGSLRWWYHAADTVFSSGAFANINSDSRLEFLIGTDISQNTKLNPPTPNGGFLYAFSTAPRKKKRIWFQEKGAFLWRATLDQVVQSSPVVAEVLGSSSGREVIVGSGCYFPSKGKPKRGNWIKIYRAKDGELLQTLRTPVCSSSSPAVADIDEDGEAEIFATINGQTSLGGDGKSRLAMWKAGNVDPVWSVIPVTGGKNDSSAGQFISPVVADVDGSGSLEVVVAHRNSILLFSATDGAQLTCGGRFCGSDEPFLRTGSSHRATPAIGDVNNDGVLDILIGGKGGSKGRVFSWTNLGEVLQSAAGPHAPYYAPWPMARGNAARDGRAR